MTPGIKDPVVAGAYAYDIFDNTKLTFNGYIEADKAAFTYDAANTSTSTGFQQSAL